MSKQAEQLFQTALWTYYDRYGRHDLPWRLPEPGGTFDPYRIMVSEIMLQQTQVQRVIVKYQQFLERFPTSEALAAAPLSQVLILWRGLGYNRRAKFLWQAAQLIQTEHQGSFPDTVGGLVRLPGIGHNTAGAIMAYAFNRPVAFVETNIRTVYLHHFFPGRSDVTDREILQLVSRTFMPKQPRQFYWAVMDYGAHLKATVGNLNTASKSYSKQSPFAGSRRQVRGNVIRLLTMQTSSLEQLQADINDERLESVLADLVREQLIETIAGKYRLA